MYRKYGKRFIDVFLSLVGLIILLPIMVIAAILIRLDSKGPVLFAQERMGVNGKLFHIYKFRTMVNGAINMGAGTYTYKGDPRITRIGHVLRKTSIDEFPQLVNILKGDMSIIGPRPLLNGIPYTYENCPPKYKRRYSVLPGLFCSVDVKYRANVTKEKHFEMDVEYVKDISFLNDIKIFFGTLKNVLKMESVYKDKE